MKSRLRYLVPLTLLSFLALLSCSTETHEGIEAGNPDLGEDEKVLVVVAEEVGEKYSVVYFDDGTAGVTQSELTHSQELEMVSVPYTEEDLTRTLDAAFSNGTAIDLTVDYDENEEVIAVYLLVNGREVSTSYSEEPPSGSPQTPGLNRGGGPDQPAAAAFLPDRSSDHPAAVRLERPTPAAFVPPEAHESGQGTPLPHCRANHGGPSGDENAPTDSSAPPPSSVPMEPRDTFWEGMQMADPSWRVDTLPQPTQQVEPIPMYRMR